MIYVAKFFISQALSILTNNYFWRKVIFPSPRTPFDRLSIQTACFLTHQDLYLHVNRLEKTEKSVTVDFSLLSFSRKSSAGKTRADVDRGGWEKKRRKKK